ncbi:DUF3631 domain-containing protein [Trebonia sp.]|uniref:DUF3631 domain-containing protein n=1 Tax=Trebonia sp. TaxID=2767075 RepID=UPI0026292F7D|nr:DUF3631 domain-containing protein [Trebonia sp.]
MNLDDLDRPTVGDGALVLSEVRGILTRYVVFPAPEAADAATLYAAATHVANELEFASRLVIRSPVKRCGKSRLLDVLVQLVRNPLVTSDISAAALVRSVSEQDPPTIMLDEADAIFGKALKGDEKAEHLRGILNAGFGRDRPYKRWDITLRRVENCPTFAMAVIAGIGSMPDTIEDRAVIITLRRKTEAESVAKYRTRRDKPVVRAVGDRLAAWIEGIAPEAGKAEPDMPTGLHDRAEDVWEALIAIADLAGGDWPARARKAAQVLTAAAGDTADSTLGERLLADLRLVFGDQAAMHGETILTELHGISEAPWNDYFGRPLNQRDLAKLLKPYGVSSTDVKVDGVNRKGYRRDHLHDAWRRYAPGGSATSATSATGQVSDGAEVAGSGQQALPATAAMPLASEVAEVAAVADTPGVESPQLCTKCGEPLAQAFVDAGFTDHGEDE